MREIRTFEMQHHEPATAWRIVRPLVVTVTAGQLWLTIEHDAEDYWLEEGQSFVLPAGVRAWISAGRDGVQVTVTSAGSRPQLTSLGFRVRSWIPRWLQVA